MPDSVASMDIRHLAINSSEPIDFKLLSRKIDLTKIISIRIDDLNQPLINLDLAKFKRLSSIGIFAGDKVNSINLINVGDSLTALDLSARNMAFPQFDSAFLGLTRLSYRGKSELIPQWIERLSYLQHFSFYSEQISEIECDVCKMDNIVEFSVVDREVDDKEVYLSKLAVYPTIQKLSKCKPELRFWTALPPH